MHICQGFHTIELNIAQFLQIQLQTENLSCNSKPDFMLFALALHIISI